MARCDGILQVDFEALAEGDESGQQVYGRGDSRSYSILLSSRAMKALEGAGLKVPPGLLNQLLGSCMHQLNGKKVRASNNQWLTGHPNVSTPGNSGWLCVVCIIYSSARGEKLIKYCNLGRTVL